MVSTPVHAKLLLISSILFCYHSLYAQKYSQQDKGFVTYKLGTDTTVIQYFEFDNKKINTTILSVVGSVTMFEGTGELDEAGDIKQMFSKIYSLDNSGKWTLTGEGSNIFRGDSSIYSLKRNGQEVSRRAVVGKGIVSNAADAASFFVFPYMGFFAPTKIGDTLFHCQVSFGECRKYEVVRERKNQLKVGSNVMGKLKLFVADNGRMTSGDAIGSSLNWIAAVERTNKDYKKYLTELALRKVATGTLAPRIMRDTTRLVIGDTKIEVDYWRPHRRNRQIFGAVVPWNRVWRTGSNNSTQLRTTSDLVVNGNKLPAGKYSIWTFPSETGWQIMFNKKADVWGTEYDASANLFTTELSVEKTETSVEILKISLHPQQNKIIRMMIEWEYYKAWVDLAIE